MAAAAPSWPHKHVSFSFIGPGTFAVFITLTAFFNPVIDVGLEGVTELGISLLRKDRSALWLRETLRNNVTFLKAVREMSLKILIDRRGQRSVVFFLAWQRGARKVKDLTPNEVRNLANFIERDKLATVKKANITILGNFDTEINGMYCMKDKFKPIIKCSSKELRQGRANNDPIRMFKIGMDLTNAESLSWCLKLSKCKSTKHLNTIRKPEGKNLY